MFESIARFFRRIGKKEQEQISSKDTAKERLHLVLMQDRANVSADFLELMKQEIIEVIKKYIDVDEKDIDVRLTNKTNEDGTTGAPALYANIPIVGIKQEPSNNFDLKEKEEAKEEKEDEDINKEKEIEVNKEDEKDTKEEKNTIEKAEDTENDEVKNKEEENKEPPKEENAKDKKESNNKVDAKKNDQTKKTKSEANTNNSKNKVNKKRVKHLKKTKRIC